MRTYPSLFRRVGATLVDLSVLAVIAYFMVSGPLGSERLWLQASSVLGLALLYEPVFTAFGVTLGQAIFGTRVRHHESLERITLKKSLLRFFTKYVANVFGGASANGWHRVHPRTDLRAIHDVTADTVVINAASVQRHST